MRHELAGRLRDGAVEPADLAVVAQRDHLRPLADAVVQLAQRKREQWQRLRSASVGDDGFDEPRLEFEAGGERRPGDGRRQLPHAAQGQCFHTHAANGWIGLQAAKEVSPQGAEHEQRLAGAVETRAQQAQEGLRGMSIPPLQQLFELIDDEQDGGVVSPVGPAKRTDQLAQRMGVATGAVRLRVGGAL